MSARTGLWLVGARGSVATTVACGLAAMRAGLAPETGCVTEQLPQRSGIFPSWEDFVVGGHDVTDTPLAKTAAELADSGVFNDRLLRSIESDLAAMDDEIRPGYHPVTHPGSQAAVAERLSADIGDFRRRHHLDRVVVVNVASTEPPVPTVPEHRDPDLLAAALADPARSVLPPSGLTAYSAFAAGCPYVDFTPSPGLRLPAVLEYARHRGLPFAGCDGKTGETLLRSVLAPMFSARALRVRSWSGTNLLGGGDGENLGQFDNADGKLASKARTLGALLGEDVAAPLHIDNVPDLGNRKIAWDYVSFEGFLGARMSLQFSWDGCDCALAAPLVLDLARLMAGAHHAGESGPVGALAFFFKDPLGTDEYRLAEQRRALGAWVDGIAA